MSRAKWRTLRASSLVNFYIVVLCLLLLITFFVYCNESSTFLHPKSEVKVALFYTKNCSDYSFHLSFVKNGPIKITILHICYHGFKKLDRIFPLVEIVSVIPLVIAANIFNK
jgi:hypothetical protein